MTELDVARNLRLEPRIVHALEADQFEALPAPAFVRGYLRALAKELGLDGASLIALFDRHGDHAQPALTDFETRAPLQITSDSKVMRMATIGIAITLVVLLVSWWRANRLDFTEFTRLTSEQIEEIRSMPAVSPLAYEFPQVLHSDAPMYRATDLAPPATGADTSNATVTSSGDIVLVASADAWVQITDRNDARLFYDLVKPGRELRISGQAPYALVIGNAPAVRLSYAGQAIDLSSLADEGVARLTLGANGATQESANDE
jgi:cytoskeleton protein RodZ